jgi:hypothetical protein
MAAAMRRVVVLAAVALASPASPARAQWLSLTREGAGAITVGDTVTFRAHAVLNIKAIPLQKAPSIAGPAYGVRILDADSLRRIGLGEFTGKVRVAFYRAGTQALPPLVLRYERRDLVTQRDSAVSEAVPIEIAATLPPGNMGLKDIRDLERPASVVPPALVALAVAAAGAAALGRRRRERRRLAPEPVAPVIEAPAAAPLSAREQALARLADVERAAWPARGETARQYDEVVATLRDYLDATGVRARERTTSELLRELRPRTAELGDGARAVLHAADAVRFARDEPGADAAAEHLVRTREWIVRWDIEATDAVR